MSVRTFRTAADELGSLLDYKPKVRIAEKIRELLIAIVKPARILECVEYVNRSSKLKGGGGGFLSTEGMGSLAHLHAPRARVGVHRIVTCR